MWVNRLILQYSKINSVFEILIIFPIENSKMWCFNHSANNRQIDLNALLCTGLKFRNYIWLQYRLVFFIVRIATLVLSRNELAIYTRTYASGTEEKNNTSVLLKEKVLS
jgi:hypothetical protein